jgi:hypothetical protein
MHRRGIYAASIAAALALSANPAGAINIIFSYNAGSSTPPAGDAGGANLIATMQHVESFYEDVFEDVDHTITISFWYANFTGSTLAAHSLTAQSGGRETAGTIRFDPDAVGNNWFFDPTPADNSEFNMTKQVWRNLSAATRTTKRSVAARSFSDA